MTAPVVEAVGVAVPEVDVVDLMAVVAVTEEDVLEIVMDVVLRDADVLVVVMGSPMAANGCDQKKNG